MTFTKQVAGIGGDIVSIRGGIYFVNETAIGRTKPTTLAVVALTPAAPGVIPEGTILLRRPIRTAWTRATR